MTRTNTRRRDVAELKALNEAGELVESLTLSLDEYYGGLHRLVDDDDYRATLGVRFIEGQLFSPTGLLDQSFRNRYSTTGAYVGGRTEFADGTVNED
jgi:hypothetical protein